MTGVLHAVYVQLYQSDCEKKKLTCKTRFILSLCVELPQFQLTCTNWGRVHETCGTRKKEHVSWNKPPIKRQISEIHVDLSERKKRGDNREIKVKLFFPKGRTGIVKTWETTRWWMNIYWTFINFQRCEIYITCWCKSRNITVRLSFVPSSISYGKTWPLWLIRRSV